jgi:heme/copper-type cytochrome/quinol oxidase subunit 2
MSTGARLGILAGIIAVAVVALVVANSGGSDEKTPNSTTSATTTAPTTGTSTTTDTTQAKPAGPPTHTVTVRNAKPVGGIEKIKLNKGDTVKLVVKSDVADEIHIHGYDFHKDVKAGGTVRFSFPATIDGNFEIELESRKEQIAELTVEP